MKADRMPRGGRTRVYSTAFSDADGIYLRRDERTGKLEERAHGSSIWRVGLTPAGQRLAASLGWKVQA